MLFNSLEFLVFLPIVIAVYWLLNHRWQNYFLLAASLFFYACWDWRFVFLLLLTVVVDFLVARSLESMQQRGAPTARRKLVLALSMATNLVVLGFFKYYDFFASSFQTLLQGLGLGIGIHALNIILPVGVSFYTFQSMSYTIDVYRGELPATKSFLDFTLFVCFFPHLVAGPIVRASVLLQQIESPRLPDRNQVGWGFALLCFGLFSKVVMADSIFAPLVNIEYAHPERYGMIDTWIAVLSFSGQIFYDFSGYSLCAIGLAMSFGFWFPDNFRYPYGAASFSDFWRRWHISLSSWLRDYLYIPLGGNRHGELRTYWSLIATMLIGGLWHGASWMFVAWGGLHGLYLAAERALRRTSIGPCRTS